MERANAILHGRRLRLTVQVMCPEVELLWQVDFNRVSLSPESKIVSAKQLVHIQALLRTFSPLCLNKEHNQRPF